MISKRNLIEKCSQEKLDIDDVYDVSDEELDVLRAARGLGLLSLKPWPLLEALWDRGYVVRDAEAPYTYRTVEDVAAKLDALDERAWAQEEE